MRKLGPRKDNALLRPWQSQSRISCAWFRGQLSQGRSEWTRLISGPRAWLHGHSQLRLEEGPFLGCACSHTWMDAVITPASAGSGAHWSQGTLCSSSPPLCALCGTPLGGVKPRECGLPCLQEATGHDGTASLLASPRLCVSKLSCPSPWAPRGCSPLALFHRLLLAHVLHPLCTRSLA